MILKIVNILNIFVCVIHFEDDDFELDLKFELTETKRTFELKENAVPSKFVFSDQKKEHQFSESRREKKGTKKYTR